MMQFDFKGRVALVTGGTSGIGRAVVRAFARAGAHVAFCARHDTGSAELVRAIESQGGQALFVAADVREDAAVRGLLAQVHERYGRLDFAINNAGIGGDMVSLERTDLAVFDEVIATGVRGVFVGLRHQVPAILTSGGGAIVNLCSIYGVTGRAAHHAYVAAKHAVLGLTRSVGLEYASRGVRVNALCPGVTRTAAMAQAEAAYPEVVAALVREHPMGRMASEDEVAAAALYLCSEESAFVTASPLFIDGGFTAA